MKNSATPVLFYLFVPLELTYSLNQLQCSNLYYWKCLLLAKLLLSFLFRWSYVVTHCALKIPLLKIVDRQEEYQLETANKTHRGSSFVWESISLFNSIIAVSCWDLTLLPCSVTVERLTLCDSATAVSPTHGLAYLVISHYSHITVLDAHKTTCCL